MNTACYLINKSPFTVLNFKTPYETRSRKLADYSNLKIFCCTAYAHTKQGKLETRALKCVFLGYPEGVKGYKLLCIDLQPPRCIISRDVVFNEAEMLKSHIPIDKRIQKVPSPDELQFKVELNGTKDVDVRDINYPEEERTEEVVEQPASQSSVQDYQLTRDNEKRKMKAPEKLGYADLIAYALTATNELENEEPKSYGKSIASQHSSQWLKAM